MSQRESKGGKTEGDNQWKGQYKRQRQIERDRDTNPNKERDQCLGFIRCSCSCCVSNLHPLRPSLTGALVNICVLMSNNILVLLLMVCCSVVEPVGVGVWSWTSSNSNILHGPEWTILYIILNNNVFYYSLVIEYKEVWGSQCQLVGWPMHYWFDSSMGLITQWLWIEFRQDCSRPQVCLIHESGVGFRSVQLTADFVVTTTIKGKLWSLAWPLSFGHCCSIGLTLIQVYMYYCIITSHYIMFPLIKTLCYQSAYFKNFKMFSCIITKWLFFR